MKYTLMNYSLSYRKYSPMVSNTEGNRWPMSATNVQRNVPISRQGSSAEDSSP